MEFIVWVETRLAGKRLEIREVAKMDRVATGTGPEELGLTLADGKTVLKLVQQRIVQNQIEVISAAAKAVPALRSEPADQGLTHAAATDGLWRGRCVLSPLRAVHLPGWQTSRPLAPSLDGRQADVARTELPFREMGQHHAVSTGGSTAKRVSAIIERQNFSGDGPAPHARGRPGARSACDRARRIRLARFAPSACAVR